MTTLTLLYRRDFYLSERDYKYLLAANLETKNFFKPPNMEEFGICKMCSNLFIKSFNTKVVRDLPRIRSVLTTMTLFLSLNLTMVQSAPHRAARNTPRWHFPCGGGTPAPADIGDIWGLLNDYDEDTESLSQMYHELHLKSTRVAENMGQLKRTMVHERLDGNLRFVESIDKGGFRLEGMPPVRNSEANYNPEQMDDMSYGDIARLAVFLEQARLDEDAHEPMSNSYQRMFEEIEEDIYWLLCTLQNAMHQQSQQVSQTVTHDVMSMQLRDVPDRMTRRLRDYIMIRDSADVLSYTSTHFGRQRDLFRQDSFQTNRLR